MEFLAALWLPILLSAVFVFVASSVLHMILPVHRNDAKPLPEEDEFCANLNAQNVEPGEYFFPGLCFHERHGQRGNDGKVQPWSSRLLAAFS